MWHTLGTKKWHQYKFGYKIGFGCENPLLSTFRNLHKTGWSSWRLYKVKCDGEPMHNRPSESSCNDWTQTDRLISRKRWCLVLVLVTSYKIMADVLAYNNNKSYTKPIRYVKQKILFTCFLTATQRQNIRGARKTGPTVNTEQPLLSATLIHSVSSPSRALMGTNLTCRCFPLTTTNKCSSLIYSNWNIFLPSPTRAISTIYWK